MIHEFQPVMISVPRGDLDHLCRLAREAGEDLQAYARAEYQGDHPSTVRRRDRDIQAAQAVIDAADEMQPHIG